MVVYILAGIAVLAAFLFVFFTNRKRQKNRELEYKAAAMLLKEGQLRDAIDMNKKQDMSREKLVLVVSWKEEKERKFVFDPVSGVRIGRSREGNQICVPLETVSQKHCIIFANGNSLYVQDLNSANGTFIKRGLKTFQVRKYEPVRENDRIIVGGIAFKIRSFWVDSAYL